jgi:hypothetical protein
LGLETILGENGIRGYGGEEVEFVKVEKVNDGD